MSEGSAALGHAGLEEAFDELDAEVLAAMADTRAALLAEPSNTARFRQALAHARQICARQTQAAGFQEARTMNEIAVGIDALSEIFEEVCRSVDHARP